MSGIASAKNCVRHYFLYNVCATFLAIISLIYTDTMLMMKVVMMMVVITIMIIITTRAAYRLKMIPLLLPPLLLLLMVLTVLQLLFNLQLFPQLLDVQNSSVKVQKE